MNEQILGSSFDPRLTGDISLEAVETYIRAAQHRYRSDRAACLAALDEIYASGEAPRRALNGRYAGQLLALDIAPGLTGAAETITRRWLPWKGKQFDAGASTGINRFTTDSYVPARFLWPAYRRYEEKGASTYLAFRFRTRTGPALEDRNLQVLCLDYDLPENPRLFIGVRRVLDELVQVADGYYLGKAYVHWYWGAWTRVAYFTLRPAG
jgi:hypothetical protein